MNKLVKERFEQITSQFSSLGNILVIGDIGIDKYTLGSVDRISPEAPVPVLQVLKEWEKLGLAANISHNLSTLDVDSLIIGVVGNDSKASRMEELLEENNLKTWGLVRDESRPTIFKERITTSTQQICRIDYENSSIVSPKISKLVKARFDDLLKDHKAVIIEDYSKGTLESELISYIIQICNKEKIIVCVDPGKQTTPKAYTGATLLKPNLNEAKQMIKFLGHAYHTMDIGEIGETLKRELKIEKLVITLGKDGMALWDENQKMLQIPTLADEVFDVSGAGDTAISLLTLSLLSGANLEEAAWISNCGAGVVVAKKGTATVNLIELSKFYKKMESHL